MKILVAEQDVALAEFIKEQLEAEHYGVDLVRDRPALLSAVQARRYDLTLLGLEPLAEILSQARSIRPDVLFVALSGADEPNSEQRCLDAGADDFIAKPFSLAVLMARFRALLRRRSSASTAVLALEDLELNRVRRTVKRNGSTVDLTQKEFALLEFLMERPMQPVSRAVIAKNAWKVEDENTSANTVDVYVNYIRKKLDSYGDRPVIRTVRGVGYQIGGTESASQGQSAATD